MTLEELSIYSKLHKRLEKNREMLSSLYITAGLGAQEITGMPHAPGVSDKVGSLVIEIDDLKQRIAVLEKECLQERNKLEEFINTIEDDQTRMVFRLRFIHCMVWKMVATTIGGNNTENSVKLICHRYIRSKS